MSKSIFTPQVLENTKPVEGAINSIMKLSEKFEVYIITARTEEMIEPVKEWLKNYKINENIKQIISSSYEKKQDICLKNKIDFLCDDDMRHISERKIETRVLFNKNELIDNKDYFITQSWNDIEDILL